MKVTVIETENKTDRMIQWESKEEFGKFISDIETVQRAALNWPVEPLEMHITYMDVSWNKQTGPRTIEELTTIKPSGQPE